MKNLSALAWTSLCLLAISCATVEGGEPAIPGDGDGDTASTGGASTGGKPGSTGGVVIVGSGGMQNSGGTSSTGGDPSTGGMVTDDCTDGDTESCASHAPAYPAGEVVCNNGSWLLTDCTLCEPDASVACATAPGVPANLQEGTLTCNSTGSAFLEDVNLACTECVQGGEPADCATHPGNTTGNMAGTASCGPGGYDFTECVVCDDEATPPTCADLTSGVMQGGEVVCTAGAWDDAGCTPCEPNSAVDCVDIVGGDFAYTGGTTTCNGAGTGWVEPGTCEYCGDGIVQVAAEQCDTAAAGSTTCGALEFNGLDPNAVVDTCNSDCTWETSVCGYCSAGVAEADCMEGGTCSGPGQCDNQQCGANFSCSMNCTGNAQTCTGMSCASGATCNVSSGNEGKTDIDCLEDSTCAVACGQNNSAACTIDCADGATCTNTAGNITDVTYNCASGSSCGVVCGSNSGADCVVNCESGAACSVSAAQNAAHPTGTAVCANATCTYNFQGQGTVPLGIVCEDGGICNIAVGNNDTKLSTPVRCEAGSSCAISCTVGNGTNNCSYMCDPSLAPASCSCTGSKCNKVNWVP